MGITLSQNDLDYVMKDGTYYLALVDIQEIEKVIKGYNRKLIKFVFRYNSKFIYEECVKYLHPENESKLKEFLEKMTGENIVDLLEGGFDLMSLVGNEYEVEIKKNKSKKSGKVFYNIDRIIGKANSLKLNNDDDEDFLNSLE